MALQISLEELGERHEAEYRAMLREWIEADGSYPFNDGELALADFPAFLRDLEQERTGRGLPEGTDRQITLVCLSGAGSVLGELRFRPWLAAPYRGSNGHTGYNVRHVYRHRGVATAALQGLRVIAGRDYGLPVLTMNIEGDNSFSERAIQANEGHVVAERTNKDGIAVRWYECPTLASADQHRANQNHSIVTVTGANDDLIALAEMVLNPYVVGGRLFGDVASTLVTEGGNLYSGVCIDTGSGTGFCAEHAAIAAMVTAREYRIARIVAVWRDEAGRLHVLPPCGRCRTRNQCQIHGCASSVVTRIKQQTTCLSTRSSAQCVGSR